MICTCLYTSQFLYNNFFTTKGYRIRIQDPNIIQNDMHHAYIRECNKYIEAKRTHTHTHIVALPALVRINNTIHGSIEIRYIDRSISVFQKKIDKQYKKL